MLADKISIGTSQIIKYFNILDLMRNKKGRCEMRFNANFVMSILIMIYPKMRPILFAAIDNPEHDWDDVAMRVLDGIFYYKENGE